MSFYIISKYQNVSDSLFCFLVSKFKWNLEGFFLNRKYHFNFTSISEFPIIHSIFVIEPKTNNEMFAIPLNSHILTLDLDRQCNNISFLI